LKYVLEILDDRSTPDRWRKGQRRNENLAGEHHHNAKNVVDDGSE